MDYLEPTQTASSDFYQVIADHTYDWELWYSPDGRILYCSPSCKTITGYSPADLIENPDIVSQMIVAEDREAFDAHQKEFLLGQIHKSHAEMEFGITRSDGTKRWLGHVCGPVFDNYGNFIGVRGSNRDITDRKLIEIEKAAIAKQLEERNAELERFAYTVSHDLKSPLITIKGFVGLAEKDAEKGNVSQLKSDIMRITNAADKMKQMLDDLLDLGKIGRLSSSREEVPFSKIVLEALDLLAGPITRNNVVVEIEPELPLVLVDYRKYVQLMENLIDNAINFMGEQPQPKINIGCWKKNEETICYVADNGQGIAPRYHQKIFGLFDKLDQKSEGTGIGLAIAKRTVETHDGRIWVESEGIGKGSRFCFVVPAKMPQ
jgi:PAS domain S-box-containing protein